MSDNFKQIGQRLKTLRKNQPRVTLAEAQAQALRVMAAKKNSEHWHMTDAIGSDGCRATVSTLQPKQ